jgi:hypothetical protein
MVAKIAVLPRRITDVVAIDEGEDEEGTRRGMSLRMAVRLSQVGR